MDVTRIREAAGRLTRSCVYCPKPGADVCVRVTAEGAGAQHLFAHRACAEDHGDDALYQVLTPTAPEGER
jgi:hypothetical protein